MKKYLLFVVALSIAITITACGSSASQSIQSNTETSKQEQTDASSDFLKNYKKAEFEKYNSYASVNGLDGDFIFIDGKLSDTQETQMDGDTLFYTILTDDDSNSWLVNLDTKAFTASSDIKDYSSLANTSVTIYGVYQGFSDRHKMPAMFASRVFDKTSETMMFTGWGRFAETFPDAAKGSKKDDSKIVDSGENLSESTTGTKKVEIEDYIANIPKSWIEVNPYFYLDKNGALPYIYLYTIDKVDTLDEAFEGMDEFLDGVKSSFEDVKVTSKPHKTTYGIYPAITGSFSGKLQEYDILMQMDFFDIPSGGVLVFMFGLEDGNKKNDQYISEYTEVLENLTLNENAPTATPSPKPTNTPKPTKKPTKTPTPKPTEPVATLGESNALAKAKSYLSHSSFSKQGLFEQLQYEGFSDAEAEYGVANCGADWMEQALEKAKSYLSHTAFSKSGLLEQLAYEGFTDKEAAYGVDNCEADWMEQAAKKAESYLSHSSFSRSGLLEQLLYEGFTQEQAEYGVTQVGY